MPVGFEAKKGCDTEAKAAIAEMVFERFIKDSENPRIWVDAGTSGVEVAKAIASNCEKARSRPTVVTNNLGAWETLTLHRDHTEKSADRIQRLPIYLVGGRYNKALNAIIELRSYESALKSWNPNIVIIAVSGIDEDQLYCSNEQDESPVKKALAEKKVETRVIIADHTKIGVTDFGSFIDLKEINKNADETFLLTDEYDIHKMRKEATRNKYERTLSKFQEYCGKDQVIKVKVEYPIESKANNKRERTDNGGDV